jgi:tetratricopeptide (TPR) repeat protein
MRSQKLLVFLGDCQAGALAHLYEKFVSPMTGESVRYANATTNQPSLTDAQTIGTAEIIVSQVFNTERPLNRAVTRPGAQQFKFPALFGGFLWPFAGRAPHTTNVSLPFMRSGPYPAQLGDTFLNGLIKEGIFAEEALRRYLDLDVVRMAHIDRLFELHLDALRKRERKTGFAFASMIEMRFRDAVLFDTPHHPTLPLFMPLLWDVFEQLRVPSTTIELISQSLHKAPFPGHALPIHPQIIDHFKLTFTTPESRYPYNYEGAFTFSEYVVRYVNFTWNRSLYEGIWAAQRGELRRAQDLLQEGLRTTPHSVIGWQTMAALLRRIGKLSEARSAAERSLILDPMDLAGHAELVRALLDLRELEAATAAARKALALGPANAGLHRLLAEIALRRGLIEEAAVESRRAVALRPGDSGLHALLGRALHRKGDFRGAEAAYRAAKPKSMSVAYRTSFAQVLLRLGKENEAVEIARELLSTENPHVHAMWGHIMARRNELDAAAAAFQKAIEIDPSLEQVRRALANVHARIAKGDAAKRELAEYVRKHMAGRPRFTNRSELLRYSVKQVTIPGLMLEFGVFSGHTINIIADAFPERTIYGFDSFKGLPEAWGWAAAGHFARDSLPAVRKNVELVVGWFNETLPTFLEKCPGEISLLHVDCDLYSSTKTIFDNLGNRIVPGTVIVFDEYWNYPNWKEHEFKAFQEFVNKVGLEYEYLGHTAFEQVTVRILETRRNIRGPKARAEAVAS